MKALRQIALYTVVMSLFALVNPSARAQQGTVSMAGTGTAGVHIEAFANYPDVAVKTGNATTSAFRVFNSANTELLRVGVSGNVSVGGTGSFAVGGTAPIGYQFYAETNTNNVSTAFQLRSNFTGRSRTYVANVGEWGTVISNNRDPRDGTFHELAAAPNESRAAHIVLGDTLSSRLFRVSNYKRNASGGLDEIPRLVINYDGDVTASGKLTVGGDVIVSGNIGAKYQDVAEWVPASDDLQPGTVVVLNPDRDNEVMASARAYDTTVAGVVSAQPGVILGEAAPAKEQVATMGRVRVRVDARKAPVAIGDLLVTSDRPGYAMKSIPVDVAGMAIHRPGTIIGKALQPLAEGEGEILVLLSMQ